MFRYLPEEASTIAPKIDWIHNIVTDLSVFFTVAIVGSMLYFAYRYRRQNGVDHETPQILGNHFLEMVWTVVPTIISVFIMYWGIVYYRELRAVPPGAMSINVTGQKWQWEFDYENGRKLINEAVIPVDTPVKFVMKSRDVLHSFFVPAMRVKNDVLPSIYTYVSFTPVKTGSYHIFCTEYCGLNHWDMRGQLRVVSKGEYETWFNDKSAEIMAAKMTPADKGRTVMQQKGCYSCHTIDGTPKVGPSFLNLFGKEEKLTDGKSVIVDENYIRSSILKPADEIVAGFQNLMMSFEGQITDDEMNNVIAYMKTLKGEVKVAPTPVAISAEELSKLSPEERGKRLYNEKTCVACHTLDGNKLVGPSFKGIFGRSEKLADGSSITVDEAYLKESITNPAAKLVEGYQPLMPPMPLTDSEVADMVAFLKTVK